MCAGTVKADECSELRGGLIDVPIAGKGLTGCAVGGVWVWLVLRQGGIVVILLRKDNIRAMSERGR
jgi:hypothetical protein